MHIHEYVRFMLLEGAGIINFTISHAYPEGGGGGGGEITSAIGLGNTGMETPL